MSALAEYLNDLIRIERIPSIRELGKLAGVSHVAVGKILKDETKDPTQEVLLKLAVPLHADRKKLLRLAGYVVDITPEQSTSRPDTSDVYLSLPPILDRMFRKKRLQQSAQIAMFTGGALTVDEIDQLRRGVPPTAFDEERLVRFFHKFPLEDIQEYYKAAHVPLPQQYQDLETDLRDVLKRVRTSTDGSPEALEYVVQLAKEIFERQNGESGK
ncbi:MAG TPA: helix-turn-helix transcriptional regulator [Armatimonadota bacterium]